MKKNGQNTDEKKSDEQQKEDEREGRRDDNVSHSVQAE